jgi:cytochrome c oxidase subunit 3
LTTTVLGLLFLGGQIQAWKELMELGFYIPTSPHSSFFYVLTGGHALHLFSGLLLLVYVYWRTSTPGRVLDRPNQNDLLRLCATYWHFLALLWMFLFAMISLW